MKEVDDAVKQLEVAEFPDIIEHVELFLTTEAEVCLFHGGDSVYQYWLSRCLRRCVRTRTTT